MGKKANSKSTENGNARKSDEAKEADNQDSSYLNECKKAFGFADLYSILGLNKSDATQGDSNLFFILFFLIKISGNNFVISLFI
jgi:hypothetical protein